MRIPVIDLFSGPGGLSEGFASLDNGKAFRIIVSAEMNQAAHKTLRLRSYYRLLKYSGQSLEPYYEFCLGRNDSPWNCERSRKLWDQAHDEALNITLGTPSGDSILDEALEARLEPGKDCVLIGGPPCQAYSLVGRSRNQGIFGYRPENDHRHFLYREYLRVIQKIRPAVFVMENVKGILSSKVGGRQIFRDILIDLANPSAAIGGVCTKDATYTIYSLTADAAFSEGDDVVEVDPYKYIVRSETLGIPQARHRVILLGVRNDITGKPKSINASEIHSTVNDAIKDLPKIRSRLSKQEDSATAWADLVIEHCQDLAKHADQKGKFSLSKALNEIAERISHSYSAGGLRIPMKIDHRIKPGPLISTLSDDSLDCVLNHESRGHMSGDLRRYLYAAAFAKVTGRSPKGHEEFDLPGLAPNHANWKSGHFSDRFRVQLADSPATTVTSHISKDGHYFIHPDPTQCRSLTVREAARLQTFSDNYFFQGNRTEQFHQVGNAVPPALAAKIANVVKKLIK